MSAWTITALSGIKSTLEGDARLGLYVDTVAISDRLRIGTDVPTGMQRHAIELVPGAIVVEARTPTANTERFSVSVRLAIRVWDPTDRSKVVTSNALVGVGTSEVGMLQFVEDVANALRKVELGILEMTGVECDAMPSLSQVVSDERDTAIYEVTLTWTGQHKGYHDPALRS